MASVTQCSRKRVKRRRDTTADDVLFTAHEINRFSVEDIKPNKSLAILESVSASTSAALDSQSNDINDTREYSRDSFDRFGDDLTADLLRYVSLTDCFAFESVSKGIQRSVFKSQKKLNIADKHYDSLREKLMLALVSFRSLNELLLEYALKKCVLIQEIVIDYRSDINERIIDIIHKNCSHLTSISFDGYFNTLSPKTWQLFCEKIGFNLRRLSVRGLFRHFMTKESLQTLFRLTTNLIECKISDFDLLIFKSDEIAHVLPKLTKISSFFDRESDFESLADIYSNRVKTIVLKHIDVNENIDIPMERMRVMFEQLSRFRRLERLRIDFDGLSNVANIGTAFRVIANNFEKLRELYITSDASIFKHVRHDWPSLSRLTLTDGIFADLNLSDLRCCPRLTSLSIHFLEFEPNSNPSYAFTRIDSYLPKLRSIDLNVCDCDTSQLLETLALLKELYFIKLRISWKRVTDTQLRQFIKQSQSIRKIHIHRVKTISRETVDGFVWHAKSLPNGHNYGLRVKVAVEYDYDSDDNDDQLVASIGDNEIKARTQHECRKRCDDRERRKSVDSFDGRAKRLAKGPAVGVESEKLSSLVTAVDDTRLTDLWQRIRHRLFSLSSSQLSLGFAPNGTTTYFSSNCDESDANRVKQFMESNSLESWNTRVFRVDKDCYEIRFALVLSTEDPTECEFLDRHSSQHFRLTSGDYAPILAVVNEHLEEARKVANNESEEKMIYFISHFLTGDITHHMNGSRKWIQNKDPVIETHIGFINKYRDPFAIRAEFLGLVAVVNKEMSKKFNALVECAESLLPLMPWPKTFEKERFLRPDFTSLDVLTYASSGIAIGYNLPLYEQIKQNEGFKNLSFGNVIIAHIKDSSPNFLSAADSALIEKYAIAADEVQTGLHELLGHGSGRLFRSAEDMAIVNPLTNSPIGMYYKSGESYQSKFGSLGLAFEECRAECVELYLCLEQTVLEVFGFSGEDADHVVYVNWLSMVHRGIESLKMYANGKWSQAHSQARYVIMRVLLETAPQLLNVELIESSPIDGKPDLLITLREDLIRSDGKKAIEQFLLRLQVYKSCADVESARVLFDKYSTVADDLQYQFLTFRDIVLARKKPRKLFVQSSTRLNSTGDDVVLKYYDSTHSGLIESYMDHFADERIEEIVTQLWQKDAKHFE